MMDQIQDIQLFNTRLMMRGMLDSGYKDTHYALAEIVDNSIEAGAKNIDIVVVQSTQGKKQRAVWHVSKIAVIDDGCGIAPELLSRVLTFGDGTHEDAMTKGGDDFGRMGKYGFGLPNSSASQSDDIQVYSWVDGPESVQCTSLDVKKVLDGTMKRQTLAAPTPFPPHLISMMKAIESVPGKSGTVVLWDDVQRCSWRRSGTLVDNVERTIGRIFRKFMANAGVVIRVSVFNDTNYEKPVSAARPLHVNDPLFLLPNAYADKLRPASLEIPADEPVFFSVPPESVSRDDIVVPYTTTSGEPATAVVKLRFSKCRPELRQRVNNRAPGSSEFGKFARENEGLSILRAGRELQLSRAWLPDVDTRHRWWGAELDFPPALDDVFGVTNNKQSATRLEAMADVDPEELAEDFTRDWNLAHPGDEREFFFEDMISEMKRAGDMRWVLYKTVSVVKKRIREIFNDLKPDRPANEYVDGEGTVFSTRGSSSDGMAGTDPANIALSVYEPGKVVAEEKQQELVDEIVPDDGTETSMTERERLMKWLQESPDANAYFTRVKMGSTAFFDCSCSYGKFVVKFNEEHPATQDLYLALGDLLNDDNTLTVGPEELFTKIDDLKVCLSLMFLAWARVEMNLERKERLRAVALRQAWGERLDELLEVFNSQKK